MRTTQTSRSSRPISLIAIALCLAASAACARDSDLTPKTSRANSPILTSSRVAPSDLAQNRDSAIRVADAPLALGCHDDAADPLIAGPAASAMITTDGGRELLSLLVACALPASVTLVATTGNPEEEIEMFGEVGLAPAWPHRPLNRADRAWVSACAFARMSGTSVASPISLRGTHPTLSSSTDELDGWTVEEGAFFGDAFTSTDRPIEWIACRGVDAGGEAGGLIDRTCAEPDPERTGLTRCGLVFAGQCADICRRKQGAYRDCRIDGMHHEVVTSFVLP